MVVSVVVVVIDAVTAGAQVYPVLITMHGGLAHLPDELGATQQSL
jgi:hypothetical protein